MRIPALELTADFDALAWKSTNVEGVSWLPLHVEGSASGATRGAATVLIRMEPGASYGAHRHLGDEEVLVLSGGYRDERGVYPRGTFVHYEAGSEHRPVACEDEGVCILFAVATGGIELLGGA
ncbi:MAG TPA: hypothetical protein ENJ09_12665 [Planctomycetes bacterium]|nr:hypothetical protein [Planctomycetota bacterium]